MSQYRKFNSQDEDVSNIIEYCQHLLQQNFCRDDYQELLKLVLLYLGSECSSSYKILQPGAIRNARWMSKILTSLKLMLLEDKIDLELPKRYIFASNQQRDKIRQFVRFVIFVYLPFWYNASCAVDAPVNDLELRTRINHHKNDQTKKAATKAFENHTWYLSELISLSLFSSKVTDLEKTDILQKLKTYQPSKSFRKRHGVGFGKPVLPKVLPNSKLSNLV